MGFFLCSIFCSFNDTYLSIKSKNHYNWGHDGILNFAMQCFIVFFSISFTLKQIHRCSSVLFFLIFVHSVNKYRTNLMIFVLQVSEPLVILDGFKRFLEFREPRKIDQTHIFNKKKNKIKSVYIPEILSEKNSRKILPLCPVLFPPFLLSHLETKTSLFN